jgi:predicted Fe-Mo cluster-binding NifX family protein
MKIAFTTSGTSLESPLDPRFGRAPRFLLYDPEEKAVVVIDNTPALNAAQGAGIQAAEAIVKAGASGLVTGHVGPKAFRVLSAAGIAVYLTDAATVADALGRWREGKLAPARSADVEGHWA